MFGKPLNTCPVTRRQINASIPLVAVRYRIDWSAWFRSCEGRISRRRDSSRKSHPR